MKKTFDSVWEDIYAAGQQLNKYPYDEVVSFIFRYADRSVARQDIKILEVGCGAGNNLWFAAREGFDVTGLDGSPSAIDFARRRFESEALKARFDTGDFTALPYGDECFDMAIDRAALTHTNEEGAQKAVAEIIRVLKPGGLFFSHIFGEEALLDGEKADGDVHVNVKGAYENVGQVRLYNQKKLEALFMPSQWEYCEWFKITKESVLDEKKFVTWQLVLRKRP